MLAALPPEQWEAPSLCDGWAVRDVVGHLLHQNAIYRLPLRTVTLLRYRLDVDRFLAEEARVRARNGSPGELIADVEEARFEETILWRVTPWPQFALSEFVIHGRDIGRPLGIASTVGVEQLALIADVFVRQVGLRVFRKRVPNVRFEATDADWSNGSGPAVRGPLEAIVMVLAGRRDAIRDLTGDGVGRL